MDEQSTGGKPKVQETISEVAPVPNSDSNAIKRLSPAAAKLVGYMAEQDRSAREAAPVKAAQAAVEASNVIAEQIKTLTDDGFTFDAAMQIILAGHHIYAGTYAGVPINWPPPLG